MRYKNKYTSSSPMILLPWVFVIVVAVCAYHAVTRLDIQTFKADGDNSQVYIESSKLTQCVSALPEKTAVTSDEMKNCLQTAKTSSEGFDQAVKPRLDELKWLLTLIGGLGAFFAIAQGAAAWFSADVYTRQAQKGLDEITTAQDAIRARYPLFEHVEEIRKDAIDSLNNVFSAASKVPDSWAGNTEALDWNDNLFRALDVEKRQRLLSVESFASIDLDHSFNAADHAEILRKFSLFYRAKFLYEDGVCRGSFCDLERAEAYLILANSKKSDFTIKNDLGSLYGTIYRAIKYTRSESLDDAKLYLQKSENAFCESLKIEPDQQRGHYSLAVIYGHHRKQYKQAIDEMTLALEHTAWQREPSEYMQAIMYYNMACYQSRMLQQGWSTVNPITVDEAKTVTDYLEKAGKVSYVRKDYITKDFDNEKEGDFIGLLAAAAADLKTKMTELRAVLDKNADEGEATAKITKAPAKPPNLGEAITEAAKLIQDALKALAERCKP